MNPSKDPTIQKVLDAVLGKPDALRELSEALVTRNVDLIRDAVSGSAGIFLTEAEVRRVIDFLPRDARQALAYAT